jgi:two-component system chemotaxis response regulator CheY
MSAVSFLIADPSAALQKFLQQVLAEYGVDAAAIKGATSAQAAAEMARSHQPDFVVADWFADETPTGLQLCQDIVKFRPACQFALLSQHHKGNEEQQAREAGALFFLAKPFSADDLRGALRKALEVLAKTHPQIARQIGGRAPAPGSQQRRPVQIQLPSLPQFKPGDRVTYRDRVEVVQHVILRRGEMVVQLQGVAGLIEATKVQHR